MEECRVMLKSTRYNGGLHLLHSAVGLHANCRDAAFESLSESMFLPKNLPSTRNCEKSWEGYLKQTDLLKISYTEREKLQK